MVVKGVNINELPKETVKKLGLGKLAEGGKVPPRTVVLGKILQAIEGLTTRDALWALRTAATYVTGVRKGRDASTARKIAGSHASARSLQK